MRKKVCKLSRKSECSFLLIIFAGWSKVSRKVSVNVFLYVCVGVCVWKRNRKRESEIDIEKKKGEEEGEGEGDDWKSKNFILA